MSNKLCIDTSSLCVNQYEDAPRKGVTVPQNITVILPAYNEQDSIGSVILLTKSYADNVIVVDDGSSDRTAEIARQAGVEVVIHEKLTREKEELLRLGLRLQPITELTLLLLWIPMVSTILLRSQN